ncbi:adenine phosphoribosyltransferase [archaeon]|nr:adenine phosphoribosyltransferase [archaeon]
MEHIKSKIRTIPDFPKKGIMFRDITTLLKDAEGFSDVVNAFYERYKGMKIDKVVGIESRGFIIGSALAHRLGVGFVPARKPGKLPAKSIRKEYELEYGKDALEIHEDAIAKGENVLLCDDLLATGGTVLAAAQLIEEMGGNVVECGFIVELPELKGREKIGKYNMFRLVEFEGE